MKFYADFPIKQELSDNEHLMFRGNSLATKAMEAYMKLVADEYLKVGFFPLLHTIDREKLFLSLCSLALFEYVWSVMTFLP